MTMEEKAETIWIMLVLKPCPKELAARSVMVMASASSTRPAASPGRSMPVRFPMLKIVIYFRKSSTPMRIPMVISAALQDFISA